MARKPLTAKSKTNPATPAKKRKKTSEEARILRASVRANDALYRLLAGR